MADLKEFRKMNGLSQKDIAEEAGVSRSFIGQVESGFSKLPNDKLDKLLANKKGWNVTCLVEKDGFSGDRIEQNGGRGNIGKISGDAGEIVALRKENEMLRSQLEELKAQNEKYWNMIERLTERGV